MKKVAALFFCGSLFLFSGCGGEESSKGKSDKKKHIDLDTSSMKEQMGEEMYERTRTIFYSMPSPLELQSIIEEAGGYFRADLLHDPLVSSKYQTTEQQAMALGVYGTNLSYSTVYKQQQEALLHLAAAQRVAKKMGVTDPFKGHLIDRANSNIDNKDSMMLIVSEMYWEMNSQLQEENRNQLGLLVLASGWVEGVYLGSQMLDKENPEKNVADVLAEQRYIASQLNDMIKEYNDDPLIATSQVVFQPLIDQYLGLKLNQEPAQLKEKDGKMVIGGNQTIDYTTEDLNQIRTKAAEARAKLIAL